MNDYVSPEWRQLRSDIYIRDKGICWICNSFVELSDYDLGHLVDRVNGGATAYDNLAVMHRKCNLSKPKHTTLEEAMKWKLTPKYLTQHRHTSNIRLIPTLANNSYQSPIPRKIIRKIHQHPNTTNEEKDTMKQLVIEYFNNRPELLKGNVNHERSEALRQLSQTLNISIIYIRKWMVEAQLVKPRKIIANGSQYKYIYENLDELLTKTRNYEPNGLSHYGEEIMYYLAGMPEHVHSCDYNKIAYKSAMLGLMVRPRTKG